MKLIEIIRELQRQGNVINYYHRKDGGYIITSINGIKYRGATGNNVARSMLGTTLEESISSNKGLIRTLGKNISYKKGRAKKEKLDEDVKKSLRRVQRKWRKNFKDKKGYGTITTRAVREHLKKYGKEATLEHLKQLENYSKGIAYDKNIEALASYIRDLASKLTGEAQQVALNLAEDIILKGLGYIKEEDIYPCYILLYNLKGDMVQSLQIQILNEARMILKL